MNIYSFIIVWGKIYNKSMADTESTESDRLDILIDTHTDAIDKYDAVSTDSIIADALLVSTALDVFNTTQQKEPLFGCLFDLMKTSQLHFQRVLETTPETKDEKLKTLLNRIFTIESKWYTTSGSSPEFDDKKDMTQEFARLIVSSIKVPIPSLLFIEFFLYVCESIVELTRELTPGLGEPDKLNILMYVGLIGKVARLTDNESILNTGVELNNIEVLTPENTKQVKDIKDKIVKLHNKNRRNPKGRLQITLAFASAIGYFCEEFIKGKVPSAVTGHTQEDEEEEEKSPPSLFVRHLYTQQFLNDSPVVHQIAKLKVNGWCPFIFKTAGCYDRSPFHNRKHLHPTNYIDRRRCFYDILTNEAVMIDPRAWPNLYKFTPRHNRDGPPAKRARWEHSGGVGMRPRIMSRKLKKQSQISRNTITHHRKHHTRIRRPTSSKHASTRRRTTRRRRR
jgi:hypothetical protein